MSPVGELMQTVAEGMARPEEAAESGEEETEVDLEAERESAESQRRHLLLTEYQVDVQR
jgi:hypothetical protein